MKVEKLFCMFSFISFIIHGPYYKLLLIEKIYFFIHCPKKSLLKCTRLCHTFNANATALCSKGMSWVDVLESLDAEHLLMPRDCKVTGH